MLRVVLSALLFCQASAFSVSLASGFGATSNLKAIRSSTPLPLSTPAPFRLRGGGGKGLKCAAGELAGPGADGLKGGGGQELTAARVRDQLTKAFGVLRTNSQAAQGDDEAEKESGDPSLSFALKDPKPPAPGSRNSVLVIGVAGGSGGGKSVFCKKLEHMLKDFCPTVVLSHDSYYKDKPEVDRDCAGNWDCPDALNTHELVTDVANLKGGDPVQIPIYDFAANARVKDQTVLAAFPKNEKGVLLVEGLMVLHDEKLRRNMDISIYVDCDEDTRFMRRLARDTHPLRGRGRTVADVYRAWALNVKPNHHRFVEPTKRFANMIIPHHGVFADPGHLLAVGEDPTELLDAYVDRVAGGHKEDEGEQLHTESVVEGKETTKKVGSRTLTLDEMDLDDTEAQMWPALYMLQSYVRDFIGVPAQP